jgi:hypothetical protein
MNNLVTRALEQVAATLMIDDEWSVRGERELTWTGHRLGQTFTVAGPYQSNGVQVCRISSTVPVVVAPQAEELDEVLSVLNHLSVADTLVSHPTEGLIKSHLAAVFHEETFDWRLSQFVSLAVIQLALLEARGLEQLFRGDIPRWMHPESGERSVPDDMLNIVEELFRPRGQGRSAFLSSEEFSSIESWVRNTPCFSAGGSEEGIAIEVPFGADDTSMVHLHADQVHPTLGTGLLVTLKLRLGDPQQRLSVARVAADMNWRECEHPSQHQYGAWHAKDDLLAHAYFLPNAMFAPGVALDAAIGAVNRAAWADLVLNDSQDLEPGDAASIAYDRLLGSSDDVDAIDA